MEAFSQSTFSARPYDDLRAFKDVQGKNRDHKHEHEDEEEDEEEASVWYIEQDDNDDEEDDEGDTTSRDTETMSLDSDSSHVVIKVDDDMIVGNYSRGQRKCGHRIAAMRRRRRIRRVANRQAMAGIYWARGKRW